MPREPGESGAGLFIQLNGVALSILEPHAAAEPQGEKNEEQARGQKDDGDAEPCVSHRSKRRDDASADKSDGSENCSGKARPGAMQRERCGHGCRERQAERSQHENVAEDGWKNGGLKCKAECEKKAGEKYPGCTEEDCLQGARQTTGDRGAHRDGKRHAAESETIELGGEAEMLAEDEWRG